MDIDFVVTLIELQILFVWVLSYVFFLLQFMIIINFVPDWWQWVPISMLRQKDERIYLFFNGIAFVAKRIKGNE